MLRKISRNVHLWVSVCIFLPVLIVVGSGLLLQVKKEIEWVQPPTQKGNGRFPSLGFEQILNFAQQVEVANIQSWEDIDRLDVRPGKGIIKIRGKNQWEIQLDGQTGQVLHLAYRRTDTIESIHDGSWFFEGAKLWIFLPAAVLLMIIALTGTVMMVTTLKSKYFKYYYRKQRF